MPSRNLFILAAAMQLPLALWLHGCKDDGEETTSTEDQTKPVDGEETTSTEDPKQPVNDKNNNLHAKFFQNGEYKELVADMLSKPDVVKFISRSSFFEQDIEKVTATAFPSYINESPEGLSSMTGPGFTYDRLLKEWQVDFVGDVLEYGRMQTIVSPGVVSSPALQMYMQDKPTAVMFSPLQFSGGLTSAETVLIEATGSVDFTAQQGNNQQIKNRNLVVTELYHTGYTKRDTNPPKRNAYNFAVTYLQIVDTDMEAFFQICVRAFHQILSINQMLQMPIEPKDRDNFENMTPKEQDNETELNAWELIEEVEKVWVRKANFGSRRPGNDYKNVVSIFRRQELIEQSRKRIVDAVLLEYQKSGRTVALNIGHLDMQKSEDFKTFMQIAIFKQIKQGANSEIVAELRIILKEATFIWEKTDKYATEFVEDADTQIVSLEHALKKWDAQKDSSEKDYQTAQVAKKEDRQTIAGLYLPKFLLELLTARKPMVPSKAGVLAWEQMERDLRKTSVNYLLPVAKELMTLDKYNIQYLDVVHTGKGAEIEFAEVMLVAFYYAFRSVRSHPHMHQSHSNQIIMGNSAAIYGHVGQNPWGVQPITKGLTWDKSMIFEQLRFVSVESMLEGDKSVECFKTIAERLNASEAKEVATEHVEVVEVITRRSRSKKSGIGQQISARQNRGH